MDTGSSSCDGGSERHSFRRQPAELLQLGKKQAVLEHAEWTYRYTTYRWWVQRSDFSSFGRRSSAFRQPRQILVTWHPLMAVKTLSTQERTAGYLGLQSDKLLIENEACCHTQNCLNADKTLRLLPLFERRSCAVACASSTQPIFKIQQPKGRKTLNSPPAQGTQSGPFEIHVYLAVKKGKP